MIALKTRALASLAIVWLVMAAMIFVAAGTTHYWQAWLFLMIYLAASLFVTLDLIQRDPNLLARRVSGGPFAEKEPVQRVIMTMASIGFICLLICPALDRRFGWSGASATVCLAGDVLVLLGFAGILLVFRENSFASATIELAVEQQVISSGPYALIRHPMYAAGLVVLLGIPLALGSWWGTLIIVPLVPVLVWRLSHEEQVLARQLPAYREYQNRVPYRLLPLVW